MKTQRKFSGIKIKAKFTSLTMSETKLHFTLFQNEFRTQFAKKTY